MRHWMVRSLLALVLLGGALVPAGVLAANASVELTLLACPAGTDPVKSPEACTQPVEDQSGITLTPAGGSVGPSTGAAEHEVGSGVYTFLDVTPGLYELTNVIPEQYDIVVARVDDKLVHADHARFRVNDGATTRVTIYYSNVSVGLDLNATEPATPAAGATPMTIASPTSVAETGTVRIRLIACPKEVDPTADASSCTRVLPAEGSETLHNRDTGDEVDVVGFKQDHDGYYVVTGLSEGTWDLEGFEPITRSGVYMDGARERDGVTSVRVTSGQRVTVDVYYYDAVHR